MNLQQTYLKTLAFDLPAERLFSRSRKYTRTICMNIWISKYLT